MEKNERGDSPANKVKSEPEVDFPADFASFDQSPAAAFTVVPEKSQPVVMTSGPKFVPVKLTPVTRRQLQSPPHLKQIAVGLIHSEIQPLYCECFASGIYCDGCKCNNCHNNVENEPARREAVEATLERKPHAFRPKIASSSYGARDNKQETGDGLVLAKHNKGCHCKKIGCLKKYCECFQANILCSENCKCMDCKNFEGSEERQALFHGYHANNTVYLRQGEKAAITGAIGSSGYGFPPVNKKRKGQELFFGSTIKDPIHRHGQLQQVNNIFHHLSNAFSTV
ncbi:unnamed protein product [Withania somnifera]